MILGDNNPVRIDKKIRTEVIINTVNLFFETHSLNIKNAESIQNVIIIKDIIPIIILKVNFFLFFFILRIINSKPY